MAESNFRTLLTRWQRLSLSLDERLEQRFGEMASVTDETGLEPEVESLFDEIVEHFRSFTADQRQQVVELIAKHKKLQWSASVSGDYDTETGFRKNMTLAVIEDQGRDTRDFMMALAAHRQHGEEMGFDVDPIFIEMSGLASSVDKYGWGTTRQLFLDH